MSPGPVPAAPIPVGTAHLEALAAIHAEAFPDEPWDAAALGQILAMPGAFGLAEPGGDGFLLSLDLGEEVEIVTIAVRPAARRRGHGGRLVAALLARAGARPVHLEVAADNAAALALYAAAGFAPAGRRRGYYRRGAASVDAVLMTRPGHPQSA